MKNSKFKKTWKKVWYFIWEDNSIWSWLANVLLAFLIIKFLVYPGLGFLLGTNFPIVAVVSESMEHNSFPKGCLDSGEINILGFNIEKCYQHNYIICGKSYDERIKFNYDEYWEICGAWYENNIDLSKEEFAEFKFQNGFNTGDIMILRGSTQENVEIGDVLVFQSRNLPDPIIHRVVDIKEDGGWAAMTKGDHNAVADNGYVTEDRIVGKAMVRVPYLGYIKIWFVELIRFILRGIAYVLS